MIQSALLVMLAWLIVNGVDRVMSWQTFARPIVTAAITGLVLGDLTTGVVMGASLEAIFMGISAIGGSVPADACSASIIAVAMTILTGVDTETGLALAMPIGTLMATVGEMYKPVLASLAPYWEHLAGTGNMKSFRIQTILCGLFVDRLPQTIILFLAVAFGVEGLQSVIGNLPAWVMSGLSAASGMMTGVGFAILTSMIWDKEIGGFFFVGFVLSKYLGLGQLPIAIIMAVVAIMYFYNDKKLLDAKTPQAPAPSAKGNTWKEIF